MTTTLTCCEFPGDFRPLLDGDLCKLRSSTWEEYHTSDRLLQTSFMIIVK